ncbi:hypothetical protein TNCT_134691 [Trichonephila clavata]|uniref:BTB domain-containing protein n=1 Tax=Trichonephila clavata TaxID=2740835 RepID=A0A8X6KZ04_TRICU|nr:hypothetical protein TNCT_134691 [Trichonephila clavata]
MTKWRLVLYPKVKIGNYIFLYLKRLLGCMKLESIQIDYELSFLTEDGKILKPNFVSNDTFQRGQAKGESQLKMPEEMFHSKCVPEGILTAYCTIWLDDALRSMYSEGLFCDTKLRTSTKTFSAHKNILSARSPIFKEMFRKDMKDKTTGCVGITDIDADTIHRMLLYLYTDTLEDLKWETASEMYVTADKYQIISLKRKCSTFLTVNLTVNNVSEVLILAIKHQDEDLKNAVQDYILRNDKAVFCSSEWKHLMDTHTKLAAETMFLKYYKS